MSVYFLEGDCRDVLKRAPDNSVHCVVTSPPYWGLRDYGTAKWKGGDPECDHLRPAAHGYAPYETSTLGPKRDGISENNSSHSDGVKRQQYAQRCKRCGAVREDRQIGLEATPDEYIANLVEVFREVRRVLRPDGTLWLNIGDSYTGSGKGGNPDSSPHKKQKTNSGSLLVSTYRDSDTRREAAVTNVSRTLCREAGIKPKDLCMIPARLALALQADGWWIRSDIIWHKPNPMPESVRDRPTKAHEYVFLLTKSARYFYDATAIAEPIATAPNAQSRNSKNTPMERGPREGGNGGLQNTALRMRSGDVSTRNARSVWTITPKPFKGAHFATMPPELAERCIRAGTSEHGCCAACGAPWARVVKRTKMEVEPGPTREARSENGRLRTQMCGTMTKAPTAETVGWKPGCKCGADVVPCTVLDPFGGASTTPYVAEQLGRDGISIELNPEYIEIGRQRF